MLTVFDTLASVLLRELEILTEPGKQAGSQSGKSLQMANEGSLVSDAITCISNLDMDSGKAASEYVDRRRKQSNPFYSDPRTGLDEGSISRSNGYSRSVVIHVSLRQPGRMPILKCHLNRR